MLDDPFVNWSIYIANRFTYISIVFVILLRASVSTAIFMMID